MCIGLLLLIDFDNKVAPFVLISENEAAEWAKVFFHEEVFGLLNM